MTSTIIFAAPAWSSSPSCIPHASSSSSRRSSTRATPRFQIANANMVESQNKPSCGSEGSLPEVWPYRPWMCSAVWINRTSSRTTAEMAEGELDGVPDDGGMR